MEDFKIAVIGAGLTGGRIAQTRTQTGYGMANIDFYIPTLDEARSNIEKLFDRKTAEGTITKGEEAEIMGRPTYSCDLGDVKGTSIVIGAVPEKMEIKRDTFKKVDKLADSDTIIVSNTSVLSISEVAPATERADKMMGVHFSYPAPAMKLAELIRGVAASGDIYGKVRVLAIDTKEEVADYSKSPGFIVNRVLAPMMNEVAFLVMRGCKPENMDKATKLGANHPMGLPELCDFAGVDIILATITGLYNGFRDSKYRSCPILENMMKAGHLGHKAGQGFYQYIQQGDNEDERYSNSKRSPDGSGKF